MAEIGVTIIRVLNAISALVLVVAGGWILFSNISHLNIWGIFTACYIILYGILLVATEIKMEKLLDYFGFLKTFLGRGLFYIFLAGVVCYIYPTTSSGDIAAEIWGTILFGLGILYILMNVYPKGQIGNLQRVLILFNSLVISMSYQILNAWIFYYKESHYLCFDQLFSEDYILEGRCI